MTKTLTEPWHGTLGGYTNHDCRCEKCRDANTRYQKQRRQARREKTPFHLIPHGANGYGNYGCRCMECLEGHRAAAGGLHPRPPAQCGTNRGYHAHWYRREDACSACLEAHAAYERDRKAGGVS